MVKHFYPKQLFIGFAILFLGLQLSAQEPPAQYQVSPTSIYDKPERIGVNLGTWATYGAQQFSTNILMNPGFEGELDRVFVFVDSTSGNTFFDQPGWGYDDNYWAGASYRVMSGTSEGSTGTVTSSLYSDPITGLPAYTVVGTLPTLDAFDAIVLTKMTNTDPVPIWWIPFPEQISVDPTDPRPCSPGMQSLKMTPSAEQPAEVNFYLDAESDHAGKFLLVAGKWKFSIWAKSDGVDPVLNVMFRRINGTDPFLLTSFNLNNEWQEYSITFDAEDTGDPQTLQLQLQATSSEGSIWVDDVFLGPIQSNSNFPFRKEVVSLLREMRPSFIRDTQGQLSDAFFNRVQSLWGRRATTSRYYNAPPSIATLYSIGDLLTLCKATEANPWIVVPAVFSSEEAYELGRYLAAHASKKEFSKVIIEFGNENWNYQFRSAGVPYVNVHGILAENSFQNIVAGAGRGVNLIKVVNGQYVNPIGALGFLLSAPSADAIAVAPYFFPELNTGTSELDNLTELFATDTYMEELAIYATAVNKKIFVYETNLTTVEGDAPPSERDAYTTGAAAGASLAMRLINNMKLKVDPQCIYSFSQYDIYSWSAGDYVKLWGITRDISPTLRMRPQGLAMNMLNKVISGSVYNVTPIGEEALNNLAVVAFRNSERWNVAAVNPNPDPATIQVYFPEDGRELPLKLLTLHYMTSPLDTNEDEENVTIVNTTVHQEARTATFTIPAWGFVVGKGGDPLPVCR